MRYLVTKRYLCQQILNRLWGSWERDRRRRKGCHKSSPNRTKEPESRSVSARCCWLSWNCLPEMPGDKNLFSRCIDAALLAALLKQAIASWVSVTMKPWELLALDTWTLRYHQHPTLLYLCVFVYLLRNAMFTAEGAFSSLHHVWLTVWAHVNIFIQRLVLVVSVSHRYRQVFASIGNGRYWYRQRKKPTIPNVASNIRW